MKTIKNISGFLFLAFLGLAVFMGITIYNQIKTSTFPIIEPLTMEDYFINIANSVIRGGEIEIPDEIITSLIKKETDEEIACVVSDENTLLIFTTRELPIIGTTDVCVEFVLEPYERGDENINFTFKNCYLGTYKAPELLYNNLFSDSYETDTLTIKSEVYSIDFMDYNLALSFDTMDIKEGKLYVKFIADAGLKLS